MIESLTPEQEAQIPIYVQKWIAIGTDTSRFTQEHAEEIVNDIYKNILNLPNPTVVIRKSPIHCWSFIEEYHHKKMKFNWPYSYGQFDVNIFGYYDYCINELKQELDPEVLRKYEFWKRTSELGIMYMFDDYCIVSEKPMELHFNDQKLLHNDNGPAIQYSDDFCVYALNGVRMNKEYVETSWDKIDPIVVIKETNAEVRRELVRKIGIERLIEKIGAEVVDTKTITVNRSSNLQIADLIATMESEVIDKELKYELLMLDIGDGNKRPYLKMINPSIGTYHIEGVHPDCKTVDDALASRNGTKIKPDILT